MGDLVFPRVEPLDCFRMLADLDAAGVSNAEVSRRLGHKSRSTVENWKNRGSQPTLVQRVRFEALYAYVMETHRRSFHDVLT